MRDNHKEKSVHKKVKKRFGSSIKDGAAHQKDHSKWSRRNFLVNTGLFTLGSGMLLGKSPVNAFQPNPFLASLCTNECDRTLVLIRLEGGNDGLNTVIHRGDDEYYNIRPTLAVPESGLWALSDEYGMPNEMLELQSMWGDGRMKIVHNVGYPQPDYSHFRSSDIWATASDADENKYTGWVGRFLDNEFPAYLAAPPTIPPALQIGVSTNILFRADHGNMALAVSNPTEFYQIAQTGELYSSDNLGNCASDVELSYLRQTANNAFRYSETIKEAYNGGINEATYPDNYLAEQLAIVARLIKGQLGTKIYMVTIGGFDTHAEQNPDHNILLNNLATAVKAFYNDIDAANLSDDVLTMTFSEFGRTIFENGSLGTDHGTGAPLMLFGGENLGSGFVGTAPDLLSVGPYEDPEFDVDFRSVYATVLEDWLCSDSSISDYVLGQPFETINGLVPAGTPSVGSNDTAALLGHQPSQITPGNIAIKYSIYRRGSVRLRILDQAGQALRVLFNEFKERGSYTFDFNPAVYYLPPGQYVYQMDTGGKVYSRRVWW